MNKPVKTIDDVSQSTWTAWEAWFAVRRTRGEHPTLHSALTALKNAALDTVKPISMVRFITDNPTVLMLKTMFSADETVIDTIRVSLASHAERQHREAVKSLIKDLNRLVLSTRCRDLIAKTSSLIQIVRPGRITSVDDAEKALDNFCEQPAHYANTLAINLMRMSTDLQLLAAKNEIFYREKDIPSFLEEVRDINELMSLDRAWFNEALAGCLEAEKQQISTNGKV